MPKAIYVNLAVADLERSKAFFSALGFTFDARFTNEDAAAMVISPCIYAMLHTDRSIRRFTAKALVDPAQATEVLLALEVDSRAEVDTLMNKALTAGARRQRPAEDHGFMYGESFEDLDGHIWELFWMDSATAPNDSAA